MKLNNVHHIAVNTLDIETSIAFYRDMFGFEEEKRADMGNCILVYLKISPDSYMELFDLKGDCESGSIPENLQGLRHIAFDVQDIEAWNQRLYINEGGLGDEVTARLQALQNVAQSDNFYDLQADNFDADVYEAEAFKEDESEEFDAGGTL